MKVKVKSNVREYTGFYIDGKGECVKFNETFDGNTKAFVKHIAETRFVAARKVFVDTYKSRVDVYEISAEDVRKYGKKIEVADDEAAVEGSEE